MSDGTFKALTDSLTSTGNKILSDTEALNTQTHSLLGQIDDTCKLLPSIVYQGLEPGFLSWKSMLGRSDDERERLGNVLKMAAQAIEQNERQIQQRFTPPKK
jgi:hypothetical protein